MVGILANSSSQTMTSGDTTADNSVTGYIRNERVTLGVSPLASSSYVWALALPSGSNSTKAALTDATASSPAFTPDIGGTYTLTCTVDGTTTYAMRLAALDTAVSEPAEALRFTPRADAQVGTPSAGLAVYYSTDLGALASKNPAGLVAPLDIGNPEVINFSEPDAEPSNVAGRLYWYENNLNLAMGNGVVRQLGEETQLPLCRNNTGFDITNGQVVYISGALGNHTTIALAANGATSARRTIGVATQDITANASGYVTVRGLVRGLNTNAWAEGTTLYLSDVAGAMTSTKPSGTATVVEIGTVVVQDATAGVICVDIRVVPVISSQFGIQEARPLTSSGTMSNLDVWSWTDMTFPTLTGQTPSTDLTNEAYRDTGQIKAFVRHDQDNSIHLDCQMPHEWAKTAVSLHAHVIPMAAGAGDVVWGGRYVFTNLGSELPAATGWTTIDVTSPFTADDQYLQKTVSLATCAAPANPGNSAFLSAVVSRLGSSSASDTYTTNKTTPPGTAAANLAIEAIDVHYQRLLVGSQNLTTGEVVVNPTIMYYNTTWTRGTPEVWILARSESGNQVEFEVWDVAAAARVGSAMTTTSTTLTMLSSGPLTLTSGTRQLRIRGRYTGSADVPTVGSAVLVLR